MYSLHLGKKLSDGKGLSGRGRLTLAKIDAIQNFYGRAIRDNKNHPEKMSTATWAILKHYSSTPSKPNHQDCPDGNESWCSYKRDISTGLKTHIPTKFPFTDAMVEAMTPIFSRLASKTFLEGVKNCYTHESLNHVIWSRAPVEQFVSDYETSLAISLRVCIFNDGIAKTLNRLYEECGICCVRSKFER